MQDCQIPIGSHIICHLHGRSVAFTEKKPQKSESGTALYQSWVSGSGIQISMQNVLTRKTGLPFQVFHFISNFFQNISMFELHVSLVQRYYDCVSEWPTNIIKLIIIKHHILGPREAVKMQFKSCLKCRESLKACCEENRVEAF